MIYKYIWYIYICINMHVNILIAYELITSCDMWHILTVKVELNLSKYRFLWVVFLAWLWTSEVTDTNREVIMKHEQVRTWPLPGLLGMALEQHGQPQAGTNTLWYRCHCKDAPGSGTWTRTKVPSLVFRKGPWKRINTIKYNQIQSIHQYSLFTSPCFQHADFRDCGD